MTAPAAPAVGEPELVPVADGLYAYLQPDGGWYLSNAVLAVGPDDAITIDTAATEARTRAYRAAIAGVTDRPVRTVVATHHHGDHTHGNHLFTGATVIGHTYCRERILRADYHAVLALFAGPDWGDIRPAAPGVAFRDALTLWSGGRRIELRHPGRTAHTAGDVYAWLPEERVLVCGDLVFDGGTPLLAEGSPAGLLRTLEELGELDPATVVPGHGGLCGTGALAATIGYVQWARELARSARAEGLTPLQAARAADLGRWALLRDSDRLVANLHSCYAELSGTEVDMARLAADMLELNGGPIRCHA